MSKYLFFIIIGIILFLYINSIEGLNVGERCVPLTPEEEEHNREMEGVLGSQIYDPCLFIENSFNFDRYSICYDNFSESSESISSNCECVDVGGNNICQLKTPDPNANGEAGQEVRDRIREIEEIERMTDLQKLNFVNQCASLHYNIEPNTLNVDMRPNKTDDTRHPSYCEIKRDTVGDIERDIIKSQCNLCLNVSCNQIGKQYNLPKLNCSFNFEYSETSQPNSYERYGYEKLPTFLDLENDPTFQEFVNAINTNNPIVDHPSLNLSYDTTIATIPNVKLTFSTYMLLRYIERISNGEIKTIVPGIFYCNGKIYYYVTFTTLFRIVKPNENDQYLNDPYLVRMMNKYHLLATAYRTDASYPIIHTDFPSITGIAERYFPKGTCTDSERNLIYTGSQELCEQEGHIWNDTPPSPYDTYNTLATTLLNNDINLQTPNANIDCQVQTSFSDVERVLLTDENQISFKEAFAHETDLKTEQFGQFSQLNLQTEDFANASLMLYHLINHNKDDDNYDLFNIWLQLVGSYDDKTLGFFNSPQTNEGLEDLYKVNDDNTFSALYTSIGTNNANIEHLQDKTARTFVMNDGDALRFTDDKTPHFGRSSEHGIRFSKEGRYLLYHIDFDLNSVFEISPDGTTLLVKTNADNVPSIIPPYLPLTIYKYFQDQFDIIRDIYNQLLDSEDYTDHLPAQITMDIFISILDTITFEYYMNNPQEAIRLFLTI